MIGKIVLLILAIVLVSAYTHYNFASQYDELAKIRNEIQPYADSAIESGLNQSSHINLNNYIAQGSNMP